MPLLDLGDRTVLDLAHGGEVLCALFWTTAASPAGVPAREPAAKLPALCHEQDLVPAPWH